MSDNYQTRAPHKPKYIAIGIVLGLCFMIAMESPAFFVLGVILGITLDRRQRKDEA